MSISSTRVSTSSDYAYSVVASSTVNPTLKNQDGTDFDRYNCIALVQLHINGTGTSSTDQLYIVGYSGSGGSSIVRALNTNSPNVSNRPRLFVNTSGYPAISTGHGNTYTIRVHVIKSLG